MNAIVISFYRFPLRGLLSSRLVCKLWQEKIDTDPVLWTLLLRSSCEPRTTETILLITQNMTTTQKIEFIRKHLIYFCLDFSFYWFYQGGDNTSFKEERFFLCQSGINPWKGTFGYHTKTSAVEHNVNFDLLETVPITLVLLN
jgi:hypothetical protein